MVKLLVEDESDDLRSRLEHKNFDVKADPTGFIRKEEIRAVRHVLDKLRKEIRIVTEVYIEGRRAVLKTNCATACAEADSKCANKSAKTPDQAARFEQVRIQARAYATTKRDNDLRINDRRIPALEKLLNRMRKHDDEWVARENAKVDRAVEGKEKAARARAEVQSKGAQLTKNKSKKDARIQEAGGTGSQNLPTASSPSAKATKVCQTPFQTTLKIYSTDLILQKRVGTEATLNAVDQPKQTPEI